MCLGPSSILKINLGHRFRDAAAKYDRFHVFWMNGISFEHRAVVEAREEPGVIRIGRPQKIGADSQLIDTRYDIG